MGWKIIELDNPCSLKTFNNNLMVFSLKKIIIPMSDIDVLLISNTQINISVNAMNDLVNNGVCIIVCNDQKLPNSYVLGYKVQKHSFINFKKQLEWDKNYKEYCWNWLLKIKINNQLNLLDFFKYDSSYWRKKLENVTDLNNTMYEAYISNYFFKQLYGNQFNRKKDNLINSLLNYGYVIITNMVARSLTKKGLNMNISFFHGSQYSSFPLAYDVVEIFRITIDLFVKTIVDKKIIDGVLTLNRQLKSCLLDYIANFKILVDEKYEFINNSIDKVIDWIIGKELSNHKIEYDFELEEKNETKLEEQI